ncbi:MAG: hypothetical protein V7L31_16005 [Nostoc sp.]
MKYRIEMPSVAEANKHTGICWSIIKHIPAKRSHLVILRAMPR